MLNFDRKKFVKKTLSQKIPIQAKSLQVPTGEIYVVGGFTRPGKVSDFEVLRDCFRIDRQLTVAPQERMEVARFGSPLALVHSRFLLALGGFTTKGDQTMECEAFDTRTNHWFRLAALPFPVANTTAVVMNNQHVYVLPGKQTKKSPAFLMMSVLDCGHPSMLRGDPNSREFGYSMGQHNWGYIEIANQDFIKAFPVAAIQLN